MLKKIGQKIKSGAYNKEIENAPSTKPKGKGNIKKEINTENK